MDTKTPGTTYLRYAEASDLLGVKTGTLYSWVSRGVIPHIRLSPRVVRFRRADLDQWLEQRTFQPIEEKP